MRYYEIARLREGFSLRKGEGAVHVDLDRVVPEDHIKNDKEFVAAQGEGVYFYLSGGGSLLINGRYMPVLQRPEDAAVNPGKFSLFTGRAEGPEEWQNPQSVVRELFEELRLFRGAQKLVPRCAMFQDVIDKVYAGASGETLELTPIPLLNTTLHVHYSGQEKTLDGFLHIGVRGDMNLLFIFAATLDLENLRIMDEEAGRPVFLLDTITHELQEIGRKTQGICDKDRMTPHLAAVLGAL